MWTLTTRKRKVLPKNWLKIYSDSGYNNNKKKQYNVFKKCKGGVAVEDFPQLEKSWLSFIFIVVF